MTGEFTLSYHFFAQNDKRNHLELFLDIDGTSLLETWRRYGGLRKTATESTRFKEAPPHRREYLAFTGPVSGARGRLRILRRGRFNDCRRKNTKFIKVSL